MWKRYLIGALIIAPIEGGLIGALVSAIVGNKFGDPILDTVYMFCPIGVLTGLIAGLLATWPLRKESLWSVTKYLGGFTLLFSVPWALFGILPFAWFGGILGFSIGFLTLLIRRSEQIKSRAQQSL